ncbi:C2H2-type zinc finger protein [Alloacidobacterium sp.]|uniref:C2H2-type zinc finger protein n=1 Tax=Alloacidobacterium sp. TaxID=2951999 RepID=UPI002D51F1EE|nr:C2H2-type zinc finger protein [Alloacidobacterium sp.]HYK34711.1 C2H2-type zinc finger protein [Alloacidobacterium sp.]
MNWPLAEAEVRHVTALAQSIVDQPQVNRGSAVESLLRGDRRLLAEAVLALIADYQALEARQFACPDCVSRFDTLQGLGNHRRHHHGYQREVYSGPFQCPDCPAHFRNLHALSKHRQRQHDYQDWNAGQRLKDVGSATPRA